MKAQIFTTIFSTLSLVSTAQKLSSNPLRPQTKLNLELQGVGLSVEPTIGRSFTVEFSGGIGTGGYDISSNSFTYVVTPLDPTLFVSINPKFYYNRARREAKGKNGALNAGNYFGVRVKYTSKGLAENSETYDALLFNAHWGMQRALGKRWTMNTHFGVGYAFDATDLNNSIGTIYPALDLKFSYILNKNRG